MVTKRSLEAQVEVLEEKLEKAETKLRQRLIPSLGPPPSDAKYKRALEGLYKRLKGDPEDPILGIVKEVLGK